MAYYYCAPIPKCNNENVNVYAGARSLAKHGELPIDMFFIFFLFFVCVRFICLQCLWIIMEKPLRDSCLRAHIQPNPIAFQFSNKFDNEWNDYLLIYLYCCCCYCYFYFYGFRLCVSSFFACVLRRVFWAPITPSSVRSLLLFHSV